MNILVSGDGNSPQCVLHFGLGMLGSAISASLKRNGYRTAAVVPIHWSDQTHRCGAYRKLAGNLDAALGSVSGTARISVVWSAGRANFYSDSPEAEHEMSIFRDHLRFIQSLLDIRAPAAMDYHFISTAGGLFESQRFVSHESPPLPLRPYGRLKLAQEQSLADLFPASAIHIYRPSSVYGPSPPRERQGLINILVQNTLGGRETVLDARLMAMRDYVLAADVGKYVSARIVHPGPAPGVRVHFLVTARSTSIFEVLATVRQVLRRQPRFRLDQNFDNHDHITFSHHVRPAGWAPVSLETGIRQFLLSRDLVAL